MSAIWWAWTCFAWLGASSPEHRAVERTLIFLAMGGVLVAATAMPDAFGEGALVFAIAYAAVRVIHVVPYFVSTRNDDQVRGAVEQRCEQGQRTRCAEPVGGEPAADLQERRTSVERRAD